MSNKLYYPATVTPYNDGPGYMITFENVPQAITGGDTFTEAVEMGIDALLVSRDFYEEDNLPFPVPACPKTGNVMIPLELEDDDELWYRASKASLTCMSQISVGEPIFNKHKTEKALIMLKGIQQLMDELNLKSNDEPLLGGYESESTAQLLDNIKAMKSTIKDCITTTQLVDNTISDEVDRCSCDFIWNAGNNPHTPIDLLELGNTVNNDISDNSEKYSGIANMFNDMPTIISISADDVVAVRKNTIYCGLVLVQHEGLFLGVSRKDDHNDIGLPGGKRNIGESAPDCAVRETLEETGYAVTLVDEPEYLGMDKNYCCQTYLATVDSDAPVDIARAETGIVGWFPKQAFLDGSFGAYNAKMFRHFGF